MASAPTALCPGAARSGWGGGDQRPHPKASPQRRSWDCCCGRRDLCSGKWKGEQIQSVPFSVPACLACLSKGLSSPVCPPLGLTPSTGLLAPTPAFQTQPAGGSIHFILSQDWAPWGGGHPQSSIQAQAPPPERRVFSLGAGAGLEGQTGRQGMMPFEPSRLLGTEGVSWR